MAPAGSCRHFPSFQISSLPPARPVVRRCSSATTGADPPPFPRVGAGSRLPAAHPVGERLIPKISPSYSTGCVLSPISLFIAAIRTDRTLQDHPVNINNTSAKLKVSSTRQRVTNLSSLSPNKIAKKNRDEHVPLRSGVNAYYIEVLGERLYGGAGRPADCCWLEIWSSSGTNIKWPRLSS